MVESIEGPSQKRRMPAINPMILLMHAEPSPVLLDSGSEDGSIESEQVQGKVAEAATVSLSE